MGRQNYPLDASILPLINIDDEQLSLPKLHSKPNRESISTPKLVPYTVHIQGGK